MKRSQWASAFVKTGVGLGRLERRLQLFDATTGGKDREASAVLAVPIANETFGTLAPGRCFPQLLYGPRIAGRAGNGCTHDELLSQHRVFSNQVSAAAGHI
jgi:hypothetical protein